MLQIAKRITLGLIVLLAMPVSVWLCGWKWQPDGSDNVLKALFAMTETVTAPWGILTCLILGCWFYGVYAFGSKQR